MESGGFLKVHADFNRHGGLGLDRRLNVLFYLNRDWDDGWGGQLELWDMTMASCVQKISPIFNRLVVFATTDHSYHGLPDPLQCPPGVIRRSLAINYYTNGRPEHERSRAHSSLYQRRPGQDPNLRRVLWKDFIPPIVGRIKRHVARKRADSQRASPPAAPPV